eukprot:gene12774-8712_t
MPPIGIEWHRLFPACLIFCSLEKCFCSDRSLCVCLCIVSAFIYIYIKKRNRKERAQVSCINCLCLVSGSVVSLYTLKGIIVLVIVVCIWRIVLISALFSYLEAFNFFVSSHALLIPDADEHHMALEFPSPPPSSSIAPARRGFAQVYHLTQPQLFLLLTLYFLLFLVLLRRSVISVPHPVAGRLVRDHHPGFLIHPKWAVEPVLCEKEVVAADGPRFSAVKSAADGNFVVHTPSPIHGGRFLCISRTISKRRALSLATIRSKMSKEFIAALPEAIVAAGAPAPPSTSGPASPPQGQAPRWGGLIDFTAAAAHVKVPMQLGPGAKGQVYHLETVSFTGRASSSPPPTSPRAVSGCMCIDVYLSSPLKETEEESVRITVKLPLVRYVAPAAQTPSPSSGPPAAVPEECIYALDLSLLTHAPFHHVRDTESLVVYYQQKSRPSRLCRKPRWYITFTEEEVQRWAAKGDQGTGALAPLELMEHIVVVSSSSNGEAERAPTRESGIPLLPSVCISLLFFDFFFGLLLLFGPSFPALKVTYILSPPLYTYQSSSRPEFEERSQKDHSFEIYMCTISLSPLSSRARRGVKTEEPADTRLTPEAMAIGTPPSTSPLPDDSPTPLVWGAALWKSWSQLPLARLLALLDTTGLQRFDPHTEVVDYTSGTFRRPGHLWLHCTRPALRFEPTPFTAVLEGGITAWKGVLRARCAERANVGTGEEEKDSGSNPHHGEEGHQQSPSPSLEQEKRLLDFLEGIKGEQQGEYGPGRIWHYAVTHPTALTSLEKAFRAFFPPNLLTVAEKVFCAPTSEYCCPSSPLVEQYLLDGLDHWLQGTAVVPPTPAVTALIAPAPPVQRMVLACGVVNPTQVMKALRPAPDADLSAAPVSPAGVSQLVDFLVDVLYPLPLQPEEAAALLEDSNKKPTKRGPPKKKEPIDGPNADTREDDVQLIDWLMLTYFANHPSLDSAGSLRHNSNPGRGRKRKHSGEKTGPSAAEAAPPLAETFFVLPRSARSGGPSTSAEATQQEEAKEHRSAALLCGAGTAAPAAGAPPKKTAKSEAVRETSSSRHREGPPQKAAKGVKRGVEESGQTLGIEPTQEQESIVEVEEEGKATGTATVSSSVMVAPPKPHKKVDGGDLLLSNAKEVRELMQVHPEYLPRGVLVAHRKPYWDPALTPWELDHHYTAKELKDLVKAILEGDMDEEEEAIRRKAATASQLVVMVDDDDDDIPETKQRRSHTTKQTADRNTGKRDNNNNNNTKSIPTEQEGVLDAEAEAKAEALVLSSSSSSLTFLPTIGSHADGNCPPAQWEKARRATRKQEFINFLLALYERRKRLYDATVNDSRERERERKIGSSSSRLSFFPKKKRGDKVGCPVSLQLDPFIGRLKKFSVRHYFIDFFIVPIRNHISYLFIYWVSSRPDCLNALLHLHLAPTSTVVAIASPLPWGGRRSSAAQGARASCPMEGRGERNHRCNSAIVPPSSSLCGRRPHLFGRRKGPEALWEAGRFFALFQAEEAKKRDPRHPSHSPAAGVVPCENTIHGVGQGCGEPPHHHAPPSPTVAAAPSFSASSVSLLGGGDTPDPCSSPRSPISRPPPPVLPSGVSHPSRAELQLFFFRYHKQQQQEKQQQRDPLVGTAVAQQAQTHSHASTQAEEADSRETLRYALDVWITLPPPPLPPSSTVALEEERQGGSPLAADATVSPWFSPHSVALRETCCQLALEAGWLQRCCAVYFSSFPSEVMEAPPQQQQQQPVEMRRLEAARRQRIGQQQVRTLHSSLLAVPTSVLQAAARLAVDHQGDEGADPRSGGEGIGERGREAVSPSPLAPTQTPTLSVPLLHSPLYRCLRVVQVVSAAFAAEGARRHGPSMVSALRLYFHTLMEMLLQEKRDPQLHRDGTSSSSRHLRLVATEALRCVVLHGGTTEATPRSSSCSRDPTDQVQDQDPPPEAEEGVSLLLLEDLVEASLRLMRYRWQSILDDHCWTAPLPHRPTASTLTSSDAGGFCASSSSPLFFSVYASTEVENHLLRDLRATVFTHIFRLLLAHPPGTMGRALLPPMWEGNRPVIPVEVCHAAMHAAVEARRWDCADFISLRMNQYWSQRRHCLRDAPTSSPPSPMQPLSAAEQDVALLQLRYMMLSRQLLNGLEWWHWWEGMQQQQQQRRRAIRTTDPDPGAVESPFVPSVALVSLLARMAGLFATSNDYHTLWLRRRQAGLGAPHCQPVGSVFRAVDDPSALALRCLTIMLHPQQPAPPSGDALFTALSACAKTGLPQLEDVLRSLTDNQVLALTPEETLYIRLLHCRGAVHWKSRVDALVPFLHRLLPSPLPLQHLQQQQQLPDFPLEDNALSERNMYRILLLLQEGNDPRSIPYYLYMRLHFFLDPPSGGAASKEREREAGGTSQQQQQQQQQPLPLTAPYPHAEMDARCLLLVLAYTTANSETLPREWIWRIAAITLGYLQLLSSGRKWPFRDLPQDVVRSLQVKWRALRLKCPPALWGSLATVLMRLPRTASAPREAAGVAWAGLLRLEDACVITPATCRQYLHRAQASAAQAPGEAAWMEEDGGAAVDSFRFLRGRRGAPATAGRLLGPNAFPSAAQLFQGVARPATHLPYSPAGLQHSRSSVEMLLLRAARRQGPQPSAPSPPAESAAPPRQEGGEGQPQSRGGATGHLPGSLRRRCRDEWLEWRGLPNVWWQEYFNISMLRCVGGCSFLYWDHARSFA